MEKRQVVEEFKNPGAAYRGKPFWSWNGELEEDELRRQVGVLKEMGFGGYFMHSRVGLITEYLGEEWFHLINAVADEGEKQGMESWLYDEDRWPSGSAGGKVTVDPQYRMLSLNVYETPVERYVPSAEDFAVFYAQVEGNAVHTYRELAAGEVPEAKEGYKVLVFRVVPDSPSSNYNGTTYIDTMNRKATERFIELTHAQYAKHAGARMGSSIKGIFTDEPHRGHLLDNLHEEDGIRVCSIAYTGDFFEEFRRRYGYDAKAMLPEVFYRKDGAVMSKVKHDYVDLANALFLERFAKPINDWCQENGIIFTGHVLHEDSLSNQTVPNGSLMRFYEYMEYPGIDLLSEFNRCYWVAKQLESAARQLGQKRLLSELYGCSGWQFNFKGHKAVGDWQALFGINLRCPHLSWYSMEGENKRDYPASIFHQASYYKDYNAVETYFARFGYVMMQGAPLCDVLVLNPIESVWGQMYLGWSQWINSVDPGVQALEHHYAVLFHMLSDHQVDFDYGDEEMISRMSSVEKTPDGAVLHVGKASYRTVVVSGMLTMRPSTCALLQKFLDCGGRVIFAGDVPSYVDSIPSEEGASLSAQPSAVRVPFEADALVQAIRANEAFRVEVVNADGSAATDIFVQARYDAETGNLYAAMINTDRARKKEGLTLRLTDVNGIALQGDVYGEEWCLQDGKRFRQEIGREGNTVTVAFDIEAAGEHVFVLTKEQDPVIPSRPVQTVTAVEKLQPDLAYSLDEKNVCVLDFAAYRFNGGAWQEPKEVLKVDQSIRSMIGIEHRGGEMLQPWYAKMKYTEVYGGVDLEYAFEVETVPTGELFLCVERPELCSYAVNGTALRYDPADGFWIDICLKKLRIPAGVIRQGRNTVTMHTEFKRTTNIESVYLIGDFGVRIEGHTSVLTTLPKKIGFDNMICYNMPFYTGCVSYRVPNATLAKALAHGKRLLIRVPSYAGSLVKVSKAGGLCDADRIVLGWDPYEADVTDWVRAGEDLDVTLVCTRKNMFGPLHLVPALTDVVGPGHFTTGGAGWNDDYVLADSKIGEIELVSVE